MLKPSVAAKAHYGQGFVSLHRWGAVAIALSVPITAGGLLAAWKLSGDGIDSWFWQSLIVTIAIASLTATFSALLQRREAQIHRLEHSEEALRFAKEAAERARDLAEEANRQHLEAERIGLIGHWYSNEASQTTTWSPQMFDMVGIPPKATLSIEEARAFIHRGDVAAFLDARRHVIATRTPTKLENRWVRADGEIRWVRMELRPKYGGDGEYLGLFGTTQDITERKLAEQQLTDAIESISEGFVLFDREDRYVLTNSNYRRLYPGIADLCVPGASFDVVMRANLDRSLHEFGAKGGEAWLQELMEWHRSCGDPMEQQLKDGRWVRAVERRTSAGGIVGIRTDITSVKEAEAALQQQVMDLESARLQLTEMAADLAKARDTAETATQTKSEFLANMSHEIRTPMNGIIGMTGLLLQTELKGEQREYAVAVRDSAEALLTVINDILDISKLEAGKVTLEEIDFDLVDTVESAVSLLGPAANEKSIELGILIEPVARAGFRGDPNRLRQVLLNLISNAVKFTERGGVSIEVGLVQQRNSDFPRLHFSVTDTGIGMSTEVQAKLFEKFSQADGSITRRFGGTGLGLAVAKQLVELMGGEIGVESSLGQGSQFWFEIPLNKAASQIITRRALPEALAQLRVLIVDDIEMNRRVLTGQLSALGIASSTSTIDGFEAMAELERAWHQGRPFDLVIIDQRMPALSGDTLVRRVRDMPEIAETKLLLASSAGTDAVPQEALARVDAVLIKPIREQSLLDAFVRLFGSSPPSPSTSPEETGNRPTATPPLRILVAEDNKINQQLTTVMLRHVGYQVDVVENGEQAVEAVRDGAYDAVLMDVQMPVLDGKEATRRIRALPSPVNRVVIIAVTAHAMAGDREEYIAIGMDDYVAKPIDRQVLLEKLAGLATDQGAEITPAEPRSMLLDYQRLEELENLSVETLHQLIDMLCKQIGSQTALMITLSAAGNLVEIGPEAHSLAGAAGNLGANELSRLAREIETASKAADGDGVAKLVNRLSALSEETSAALYHWSTARDKTCSACSWAVAREDA